MAKNTQIYYFRDFSRGRIAESSAVNFVIPTNSVSNSLNVNFDDVIGAGKVRLGTTPLGSVVASGKSPLGLGEFVGSNGTPNLMLSTFTGASNATLYYFDTSWHASNLTTLSNTSKVRFATLGSRSFMANGAVMKSSADGATWDTTNCITTDSVVPTLLYKYAGRLIASGYSAFRDRVYFSSIIDPNAIPTLTWNTNPSTGDWIDVNPDDGDNITGFSDVSNTILIFKNRNIYRLDVISTSVDPESIFGVGAPSQEAITKCQGMVYFYSGGAVYRTSGGYPEQISRLGVQDYIDAVSQSAWSSVCMGADEFNVYVSLGQLTMNGLTKYYVLKFSTRDESWSVHAYPVWYKFMIGHSDSLGKKLRGAESTGFVQTLNYGNDDNGTVIFYSLETQEINFGNKATTKIINGNIPVYTKNGIGSKLFYKSEDGDYTEISKQLPNRVDVIDNINIQGRYMKFKWEGIAASQPPRPMFEGIDFPEVKYQGIIEK